ncbi:MAG: hypothetical protein Q4C83_01225 [Candidatus Saccharibacteria bacterium]|nr:hypothetical protein [Candidatus Saccharibacteria bacterium]
MIYFLYGDNDYQIDRRADELKQQFIAKDGGDNITTVDVSAMATGEVMAQLTAVSLFAEQRFVLVKGVTAVSDVWLQLENNLDYIPSETTVVFTHIKQLSKVNNLSITKTFKKLKSSGATLEKYDLLKARDIRSWLAGEIKRRGLAVDAMAQNKLIAQTAGEENQQARLIIELDKLALLGKPITAELVEQFVEPSLETNAFAVFGAVLQGNRQLVQRLLRQLQLSGEDANRFLGLLASQELALAATITEAKVKLSPYQLSQADTMARGLGSSQSVQLAKLQQLTKLLAQLDGKLKLSRPDEAWLLIEVGLNQFLH